VSVFECESDETTLALAMSATSIRSLSLAFEPIISFALHIRPPETCSPPQRTLRGRSLWVLGRVWAGPISLVTNTRQAMFICFVGHNPPRPRRVPSAPVLQHIELVNFVFLLRRRAPRRGSNVRTAEKCIERSSTSLRLNCVAQIASFESCRLK
jgi:hypothetical protein